MKYFLDVIDNKSFLVSSSHRREWNALNFYKKHPSYATDHKSKLDKMQCVYKHIDAPNHIIFENPINLLDAI